MLAGLSLLFEKSSQDNDYPTLRFMLRMAIIPLSVVSCTGGWCIATLAIGAAVSAPSVLVRGQPGNDGSHLLVGVYPEALLLGDAGQLDVLGVELLLHDLLQRLQDQGLGVLDGKGLWFKTVSALPRP